MRVCFVVDEFFGLGKFGGFGRLTTTLATNMVKRKIETHVLVPKSGLIHQPDYTMIDGIQIHMFPMNIMTHIGINSIVKKLAKEIDADIYHSEAINTWGFHCMSVKSAKHIITCQAPPIGETWKEWSKSPYFKPKRFHRWFTTRWGVLRPLYGWIRMEAVKRADLVCSQTRYHIPLIKKKFGLNYDPVFLPNPVEVPNRKLHKSCEPTVLFLARWDAVKRPWIFFQIAKKMPNIHFICAGKSHDEVLDAKLRNIAKKIPNLEAPGHIDPKGVLEKSWVLVNCSITEALPMAFLEACAYKCAIVSCNNPDGLASNFGVHVQNGENVNEYVTALNSLISNENNLNRLGQSAYEYVKKTHELNIVIDKHLELYAGANSMRAQ